MPLTPEEALASLTAEAAIKSVLARYCHAVDDGDLDALGACFTADAGLQAFGRERTGRPDVVALLAKALPPDKRGKHLTTNTAVGDLTVDPGGTGTAGVVSDFAFIGPDGTVTTGRYQDEFTGSGGTWLISSRRIVFRG